MAMVKVVFGYPIHEEGRSYAAGEIVKIDEESLRRYPKDEYEIVRGAKGKKGKEVKDISAKDKEKSDIVLDF